MDLGKIPEIDNYIVVSNIPHNVTEDELTIYFQSKKNGGGDISSLEFIKEAENKTKTAIMKFDDLTDAANVLQRDHWYKQHLFSLQFVSNKQVNLKKKPRCKKREKKSDLQSPELNEEVTPKILNRVKKVKKSNINLPESDAVDTSNEPVNIREIELEDKMTISNEYGQKFAVTNGMSFDSNSIEEIMNSSDVNQIITDNYDSIPIDKKYWNFLISRNSTALIQLFIEMCLQIDNTSDNVLQLRFKNVSNQQMKDKFDTFFNQNASKFFEINESKIQKDNYSETQISNNYIYNTTYDGLKNDSHIVSNTSQNGNSSKTVFTYYEDIRVTVYQGDITKEVVDIVVNAANAMLDNCCGVSKAILDASQDGSVQINCDKYIVQNGRKGLNVGSIYSSVSGKLNCKNIYHAVIPRWNIYGVQSINILGDLLYNCFLKADKSNMNSIALPLISSGCFGVPKHVAAYCLVTAINTFTSDSVFSLKDIRIVDCDANTISTIFLAFEKFKRECKRSKVKQQPMMLNSDRNNISIGKMGTISKVKDRKSKGEKLNQNSSLLFHQNNPNIKKSKNKEIKNIREDTPSQKKSNLHRQKYKSEEKNEDHENSVNESESNPQNCSFSSDIFPKSKISQNKENLAFLDNNHNNSKESEREKIILHEKEKKSAIVEKTNDDWLIVTKEDLLDSKSNISVENKGKDTKLDTTNILSNENKCSEFQNFDLTSQNKKTNHEEDNDLIKFVNDENETENALLSFKNNNNNGNSSIVLSGNTDVNLEKTMIIKEDMTTISQTALSDLKNNHYSHISDSQLLVQTLLNNDKKQEVICEESVQKILQENCFYPTVPESSLIDHINHESFTEILQENCFYPIVSESSLIDHINHESFTEIIDNDKLHDVFTTEAENVETKNKNGVDSILTNFSNLSINKKEMDMAKPTDVIHNKEEDHGKMIFIDLTINKEENEVKHIHKNISKEEIDNTKSPNLIIINEEENKLKHTDLNINKEEAEVKSAGSNIKQEQADKIKFTSLIVNKEETNNLNIYKEEDKINPIDLNLNKKQADEINPANLIINKELAVIKPTDLNVNKEEVMIKPDLNISSGESMIIPTDLNINNEVIVIPTVLNINNEVVVISTHLNISNEEVMIKPIDVNIVRPSDKSINKEEVVIKLTNLNISTEEVLSTHLNINKEEVTINPTDLNISKEENMVKSIALNINKEEVKNTSSDSANQMSE